jgi:hypothetical protein
MAKTKSTTGGKTRKTVNQEPVPATTANGIPEVIVPPKAATATPAASEAKIATHSAAQTKTAPAMVPTPEPTKTTSEAKFAETKTAEAKLQTETKATPEASFTPEPRKLEVVKTEPRKNVVPINRTPVNLDEEIRRRAYELYQQRGGAPGGEAEDWLNAEREVLKRYHQQSA